MKLDKIVRGVNTYLAGEMLRYEDMEIFLDRTIDDINQSLNAKFPAFSEFITSREVDADADYNFFPDRFIRSVVMIGAAFYYYQMDEEGERVAGSYEREYRNALYLMTRDHLMMVPDEFVDDQAGYVEFRWSLGHELGISYEDICGGGKK